VWAISKAVSAANQSTDTDKTKRLGENTQLSRPGQLYTTIYPDGVASCDTQVRTFSGLILTIASSTLGFPITEF